MGRTIHRICWEGLPWLRSLSGRCRRRFSFRWGKLGVKWERTKPSYFYMAAFFVSYQIATLAGDLRWVASVLKAASGLALDF